MRKMKPCLNEMCWGNKGVCEHSRIHTEDELCSVSVPGCPPCEHCEPVKHERDEDGTSYIIYLTREQLEQVVTAVTGLQELHGCRSNVLDDIRGQAGMILNETRDN